MTYDPAKSSEIFVLNELIRSSSNEICTSDLLFRDAQELKYLTLCIGCAYDVNMSMIRFSKIKVYNFNIEKLVYAPAISCSENTVYMTCQTPGAEIYYKIGTGEFTKYTSPIQITGDVTVTAYAAGGT